MNIYYLTENIIIKDNKSYYIKDNKNLEITNLNWHKYLSEYGWVKMPLIWIRKLNSYSKIKEKNSRYGIYDCEMDGNCFYQCIANAFNHNEKITNYDHSDIRNKIADNITIDMYETLITYYRIMKDADDFDEDWNPYEIEKIEDFKKQIKKTGNNYWCDYLLLNNIIEILKLNIIILNYDVDNKNYTIYNTLIDYNSNYNTIFLLYTDNSHFKLIGYFDDEMISIFNNNTIPTELLLLMNLN